jgi:hypothetical protein
MLPKRFVAALIFCATTTKLQVHQRDAVATFGDQRWWIGSEECDDDFVGRIPITGKADGNSAMRLWYAYWTHARLSSAFQLSLHSCLSHRDYNSSQTFFSFCQWQLKVYQKRQNKNVPPWGLLNLHFPVTGHRSGRSDGGEIAL